MKYTLINNKLVLALAAALSVLAGCQKNGCDTEYAGGDSVIRFSPLVAHNAAVTKGTLINNNDNGDRSDIAFPTDKNFYATAWTSGAEAPDFGYEKVMYKESSYGNYWITVFQYDNEEYDIHNENQDKEHLWYAGQNKTFYAYANLPASGASVSSALVSSNPVQTLSVTALPATSTAQTDILLGYYTNGTTAKTDGLVPIKFYHPMTAVIFKQGTDFMEGITVSSIEIEGVYASGTATMSAATVATADKVAWSDCSGSQTVELSSVTLAADKTIGDAFILIPQEFSSTSTARIKVVLSDGSKTLDLYYPLNINTGTVDSPAYTTWKAGCTNIYTISFNDSEYTIVNGSEYTIDGPDEYNGDVLGGIPNGALSGLFSVSPTKQIRFSQGNLQYQASTKTWRFAEHQYDSILDGPGNTTVSGRDTQEAWIDLFGWGQTGRTDINPYLGQPYTRSSSPYDFMINEYMYTDDILTRENGGDWGVCMGEGWRTLNIYEWAYLLSSCTWFDDQFLENPIREGLNVTDVTVMDKPHCLVLYPDNYSGIKVDESNKTTFYSTENASNWYAAQKAGVVCLPLTGIQNDPADSPGYWGCGCYFSINCRNDGPADSEFTMEFYENTVAAGYLRERYEACAVRLVIDSDN